MKTHRQVLPKPEPLEARALLSALAHPHLAHPARVSAVSPAHSVPKTPPLQGSVAGDYTKRPSPSAVRASAPGTDLTLNGNGNVTTLGDVQLSGVIHTGVSKYAAGMGTLVLTDSQGTLKLSLRGAGGRQTLVSRLGVTSTTQLRYTIAGGTGAYRGTRGNGLITLTLTSSGLAASPPITVIGGPGSGSSDGSGSGNGSGTGVTSPVATPPVKTTPTKNSPTAYPPIHVGPGSGGPWHNGGDAAGVKAFAVIAKPPMNSTIRQGHFTLVFGGGTSTNPQPV